MTTTILRRDKARVTIMFTSGVEVADGHTRLPCQDVYDRGDSQETTSPPLISPSLPDILTHTKQLLPCQSSSIYMDVKYKPVKYFECIALTYFWYGQLVSVISCLILFYLMWPNRDCITTTPLLLTRALYVGEFQKP